VYTILYFPVFLGQNFITGQNQLKDLKIKENYYMLAFTLNFTLWKFTRGFLGHHEPCDGQMAPEITLFFQTFNVLGLYGCV
jgi:hypothetical protein